MSGSQPAHNVELTRMILAAFPALLDTAILDHMRSHMILDGNAWENQEEAATLKGHNDQGKFGNPCTKLLAMDLLISLTALQLQDASHAPLAQLCPWLGSCLKMSEGDPMEKLGGENGRKHGWNSYVHQIVFLTKSYLSPRNFPLS